MEYKDKVVWITGASSGIGEALAYAFAAQGAKLVLSARRESELQRVKSNCTNPDQVLVVPLDLLDRASFAGKIATATQHFGTVHVLLNNGGISQRGLARETSLEVDQKMMDINYFGTIALTKALLPTLLQNPKSQIGTITSLTGKFGFYLRSSYAASKHALHGFFESLRLEEEKNGLAVSLICPGFIHTDISKNALGEDGKPTGEMDNNQANGISPEACAAGILKGLKKEKEEIFVGGFERHGPRIKRYFPTLFGKMLRKKTGKG